MFNTKVTISPDQARTLAAGLMSYALERERLDCLISEAQENMDNAVDALRSIGVVKK